MPDECMTKLVIGTTSMEAMTLPQGVQGVKPKWQALVDSGANINLGPEWLAEAPGLGIVPHTDGRKIGTAKTDGEMIIIGWIFPGGYIGGIALVKDANYILVSVQLLQQHGMSVEFPRDTDICVLSTAFGTFTEITQCPDLKLYFVDLRKLIDGYMPMYIEQPDDVKFTKDVCVGGSVGYTTNVNIVQTPANRKQVPTQDMSFRVWRLHECTGHTDLTTLAHMAKYNLLGEIDVTMEEIVLVRDHQDCFACALSKWKRLSAAPSSGLRPTIVGKSWSLDFKGFFKTAAIGGFWTCRRFGYRMCELRVDMGTVENSEEFGKACHTINQDIGGAGVEVLPANVEMQQQNPVERHIQTAENMDAAIQVGQDLLGAS